MDFKCSGCGSHVGTSEVRKGTCPTCGTEKMIKMDLSTGRRRQAKEPREELLLAAMRLGQYSKEYHHSSEECGVGDWIVIPKETFDKTMCGIMDLAVELSKELNLKKKHQESLKILLGIAEDSLVV